MRTFKLVALICLLALVFSIPALAEENEWEMWIGSIDGGWAETVGNLDNSFDGGMVFGGELEYRFEEHWTLDGFLQYRSFETKASSGDDLEIVNLSFNAKYYWLPDTDTFFARGGVGWYDPQDKDDDAEFGVNFGVGYLWLFNKEKPFEGVTLSTDYHYFDGELDENEWWDIMVGLQWAFD